MTRSLAQALDAHSSGDLAVRATAGLLGVLPFAATWSPIPSLEQGALQRDEALAERIAARAERIATGEGPQSALAVFDFLDKGDSGIALFTGLRGAVKVARGQEGALEMDPQQAADAGLKAVGIAWAAWKLFPGTPPERARALLETATGRALLTWFVAADLVLPFADNLATGGATAITTLIDDKAGENAARLIAVAGPEAEQATGVLKGMLAGINASLGQAATYAAPLSAYVQEQLPGVLATADKITGVVATAVDTLACYRCLGASLVAEVCLAQAAAEVKAEAEAEEVAAENARRLAEAEVENVRIEAEAAATRAREAAAAAERAERESREAEATAREAASKQREDYTLDDAVAAASLRAAPVKVTRTAEIATSAAAPVAKAGCWGCGSVFLLAGLGAAATWIAYT